MQVDPFGQNINKPHVTHHASPHMTRVMAISPRVISPSPITFFLTPLRMLATVVSPI